MRKSAFFVCKSKGADQLHGEHAFVYIDSTIPLIPKLQASSHLQWLHCLVCDFVLNLVEKSKDMFSYEP